MTNIPLAIILGICAYSSLNIGLALEKKGASQLPKIDKVSFWRNIKNFFKNKSWLLGFLLTNISFLFLAVAMNQGPISVVTPLQGFGLVVLILFSYFFLKEKVNWQEIVGFAFIIIGIILLSIINSSEEHTYTLLEINQLLSDLESILFIICIPLCALFLCIFSIIKKFLLADLIFSLAAGIFSGLGNIFTKAFMSGLNFSDFYSSLLIAVTKWFWWIYILLMIVNNVISTIFPQIAFQRGKAIIVAPIFAIFSLLIPVFGGVIIFNEWSNDEIWILSLKTSTILLIIIGIIILSYFNAKLTRKENKEKNEIQSNILHNENY